MKILVVHNYYGSQSPSGENLVCDAEKALLRRKGHDVLEFSRFSDTLRSRRWFGELQGGLLTPWNPLAARAMDREIGRIRPDVVHVHNTFPIISPAIFSAVKGRAAVILTLHNYRIFCAAGAPFRANHICVECLRAHSPLPALRYGCYRYSRVATLPLAASISLHKALRTWERHIDGFIALSSFQQKLLVEAGLPSQRVHIKPNFFTGHPQSRPWAEKSAFVVYAGRLTEEKGVASLIEAWKRWGPSAPELKIVGDGPLRGPLEELASFSPKVRFLGQVSPESAQEQISQARLLVLPSRVFEGFPLSVIESFAFGTPVAVSNIGSLPTIVEEGHNGTLFDPADPASMLSAIQRAWDNNSFLERLGEGARRSFEELYTEERNCEILLQIYEKALIERAKRRND